MAYDTYAAMTRRLDWKNTEIVLGNVTQDSDRLGPWQHYIQDLPLMKGCAEFLLVESMKVVALPAFHFMVLSDFCCE